VKPWLKGSMASVLGAAVLLAAWHVVAAGGRTPSGATERARVSAPMRAIERRAERSEAAAAARSESEGRETSEAQGRESDHEGSEAGERDGDETTGTGSLRLEEGAALAPRARITLARALAVGRASGAGAVESVELEYDGSLLVYDVKGATAKVKVDAGSGRVVEREIEEAESTEGDGD
jgi:uncharacterized membrane protein YkoI